MMDGLRERWKQLYARDLPALARAKDSKQPHWPVYLDHCFARIVLDNAVGIDKPWTETIKSPAIKNMTEEQFKAAIELAEGVASGSEDLNGLNRRSLDLRGKNGPSKKRKSANVEASPSNKKKKDDTGSISTYFLPSSQSTRKHTFGNDDAGRDDHDSTVEAAKTPATVDIQAQLKRIADDTKLTEFRKQILSMLCQIPRGRHSTYQAMSDYITKKSHKTCARAVGSAMRHNPFAPEVPCHRILAADGTLGGFGGHWGEDGRFAQEKHKLLHEEGVRFDSKGKVKGPPFREFKMVT